MRLACNEDDDAKAGEKNAAFDVLGAGMEVVEVLAGRAGGGGGVDVAACLLAVDLHCGEDTGLQIDGGGEHARDQEELDLVAKSARLRCLPVKDERGCREDDAGDEAHDVENAEGAAHYDSGFVR